ncbi:MAG: thiamine phosphate synthase [Flavobacteriales bacterium]
MKPLDLRLYLVTDSALASRDQIPEIVEQAVWGGVTMVQLREKTADTKTRLQIAFALKETLIGYAVPLIINDRVDVALAVDADGLHIGQRDMPYEMARKLLGGDKIIGLSVENMRQVEDANQLDVDYISISPVFVTPTKPEAKNAFGIEGLKRAVRISKHKTVAIGGIHLENVSEIIRAGVDGVSVVSAIVKAQNPSSAAAELIKNISDSRL